MKIPKIEIKNHQKGQTAIITVLFLLAVSLVLGTGFMSLALRQTKSSKTFLYSIKSRAAADSGIEDVMFRLGRDMSVDASESLAVGSGSVQTSVVDVGNDKEISSSAGFDNIIRKAKALVSGGPGLEYGYGVQVGEGGFCLDSNASVLGNVFTNGNVLGPAAGGCDRYGGSGNASIAGSVSAANSFNDNPDDLESDYDQTLIFGKTTSVVDIAQQFRFTSSGPAGRLWLFLRKVGNPSPLEVRIVRNNGSSPSNNPADILAQTEIPAAQVVHFYTFVDIVFATSTLLQGNTDYWFILDGQQSTTNYYEIGQNSGTSSGQKYTANSDNPSASWTELAGQDINFRIWRGGISHKIDDVQISGPSWAHLIDNSDIKNDAVGYTFSDSTATGTVSANSIDHCTIGKDAYYNTKSNCTIYGRQITPTTAPLDPPFVPLSLISPAQLEVWRNEAVAGGTYSGSCPYRPANGAVIGPRLIPCDLEIISGRTVTLAGSVWVTGNIILESNSVLQLAPSFGPLSGALVGEHPLGSDDHKHIDIESHAVICGSEGYNGLTKKCNEGNGSYIHFIFINEPLMTSIHIESNVEGRAVFYDPHGRIKIQSEAHVRAVVVGYEFHMYPNSLLDFENELQTVGFFEGPPGTFIIRDWRTKE